MKRYVCSILPFLFFAALTSAQTITTIAGKGTSGFSGDGGPALMAEFSDPVVLAMDKHGNLYVSEVFNYRLRKINTSGVISTVTGNGTIGIPSTGTPSAGSSIGIAYGLWCDTTDEIIMTLEETVTKINTSGNFVNLAGNGVTGYNGDNIQATSAEVNITSGVVINSARELIFVDHQNFRIRKVDISGVIHTIAGGTLSTYGDGGPASATKLTYPTSLAIDKYDNIYFADSGLNVRKISTAGIITRVAGNGTQGFSGDGGPATAASFNGVQNMIFDKHGNMYIADGANHRVRKVSTNGIITTIVGNGTAGFSGDGGPATAAELNGPWGMAFDSAGNFYIADVNNQRIRKVSGLFTDVPVVADNAPEPVIFPNPFHDELTLEVNNDNYRSLAVFDLMGRIVLQQALTGNKIKINAQNISPGVYYIRLSNEHETVIKKIIKI